MNHAQVIQFINLLYLPNDPMKKEVYEFKTLSKSDILSTVWKHTYLFDEKFAHAFRQWCLNKVDFAAINPTRLNHDSGKISTRPLFVVTKNYLSKAIF